MKGCGEVRASMSLWKTPFLRNLWFIVSSPGSSHYTLAKPSRALSFISQFYSMTGVCKVRSQWNKLKKFDGILWLHLAKEKRKCLGISFPLREDHMGAQKATTARWPLETEKSLQNFMKEMKMWFLSSHLSWARLFSSTFQTMRYSKKMKMLAVTVNYFPPLILFCFNCPESKSFGRYPRPQRLRNSF